MKGLTESEVKQSREEWGTNAIPESEPTTFWDEFKETFKDPMIRILLVISCLMFVMFAMGYAEIYEPVGTVVAILIVAIISAKTGVASDSAYRKTKASIKKDVVKVYRDGVLQEIVIDDIVTNNIIVLQSGDKIPADGVIISGNIKVDNSALNGESEECKKSAINYKEGDEVSFPDKITGDTFVDNSSLFRGAVVTDGDCLCKVCKVGINTMMGKMAAEMNAEEPDSPLKVKLNKLAHQISIFGYVGAAVIAVFMLAFNVSQVGGFGAFFAQGFDVIIKSIVDAVSLATVIVVCAVPEGLPLMISLVLMQNTSKMLAHNVLVRKAVGIETAGSLNILYSDKTGTLTTRQLEVVEFFTADGASLRMDDYSQRALIDSAIVRSTQSMFDKKHKVVGGNPYALTLFYFHKYLFLCYNQLEVILDGN